MNDHIFQLTVRKGPEPGKVYELTSVSMTIGRDPMSEIPINDPEVSRRHARLIGTISGYRIQDLGSTNGTFVDGTRLGGEPLELQSGQVISIGGGVALLFQEAVDDAGHAATILDLESAYQEPEPSPLEESPVVLAAEMSDDADIASPTELNVDEPMPDIPFEEESSEPEIVSESSASETVWELPQQEQPAPSGTVDAQSYEPADYSEPVVVPHEGEPEKPSQVEQGRNYRRLSSIAAVAALLLICCCCSFFLLFYYYLGDLLLREMGFLP